MSSLLLDSSLITRVRFSNYDYKIVRSGEYLQVYFYKNGKRKDNIKNLDILDLKKRETQLELDLQEVNPTIEQEELEKSDTSTIRDNIEDKEKTIELRNIMRTKLSCQNLAKANEKEWHSFITLTYADNMQDIKQAKKDLYYFTKNIQKKKADFKYSAIIEFQKRGAIHFHLLSNLSKQDNYIIIPQKSNNKYYDIKYWNKGFTSYEEINHDTKKLIGYIAKYMTKECDNRLFGVRRFTSSQNLIKPIEETISTENKRELDYFVDLLQDKECIYENTYQDYYGNDVLFKEFKVIDKN